MSVEKPKTWKDVAMGIINSYSNPKVRNSMSNDMVQDFRTNLVRALVGVSQDEMSKASLRLSVKEIELNRTESQVFEEWREELMSNGESKSQSIDLARKKLKGDDRYLIAYKEFLDARGELNEMRELMKMGHQMLNAMSYRKEV